MNPEFRKVALIAAALGLVVSLFFALRPGDEEDAAGTPTVETAPATTAAATAETEPTTTAPPAEETVAIRIAVSGDTAPTLRKLSVRQDRKVEIVVSSELADRIHLHGYDLTADVAPGQPGRLAFTASFAGVFELELEERDLSIAELEVRP